jgi:hypothetical protein
MKAKVVGLQVQREREAEMRNFQIFSLPSMECVLSRQKNEAFRNVLSSWPEEGKGRNEE